MKGILPEPTVPDDSVTRSYERCPVRRYRSTARVQHATFALRLQCRAPDDPDPEVRAMDC